jgi:hypothetical protein
MLVSIEQLFLSVAEGVYVMRRQCNTQRLLIIFTRLAASSYAKKGVSHSSGISRPKPGASLGTK